MSVDREIWMSDLDYMIQCVDQIADANGAGGNASADNASANAATVTLALAVSMALVEIRDLKIAIAKMEAEKP